MRERDITIFQPTLSLSFSIIIRWIVERESKKYRKETVENRLCRRSLLSMLVARIGVSCFKVVKRKERVGNLSISGQPLASFAARIPWFDAFGGGRGMYGFYRGTCLARCQIVRVSSPWNHPISRFVSFLFTYLRRSTRSNKYGRKTDGRWPIRHIVARRRSSYRCSLSTSMRQNR